MFEATQAMMIYCTSPLHAGAGQAFGLIDNPIQREKHTEHPVIAGSGVKGALRHHLWRKWERGDGEQTRKLLDRIFGPEGGNKEELRAGAISFSDAQVLCFPVRSVKSGFVYATSPLCLARAQRLLTMCGEQVAWAVPAVADEEAVLLNTALLSGDDLLLEAQQFVAKIDGDAAGLKKIAEDIARIALPDGGYFSDKLQLDLVLLSDTDFSWFVRQSTVVEAHVAIEDKTGTAKDGSLHYTENLPPESILICAAMATVERKEGGLMAAAMLSPVVNALDGALVQMGGDATTGRGQVVLHFTEGQSHEG
ncbi:MAG: type III-B CRISPR module RAMP protein Cmr4 [Mariprofundales bacterium]|nr:type III-B CRISPR module RAMP protein Cmr4 [Mariprofundales bacterium]